MTAEQTFAWGDGLAPRVTKVMMHIEFADGFQAQFQTADPTDVEIHLDTKTHDRLMDQDFPATPDVIHPLFAMNEIVGVTLRMRACRDGRTTYAYVPRRPEVGHG